MSCAPWWPTSAHLAPRLLPAMPSVESGATVSFGRILVSQEGITLDAWWPPGELLPWSQVKSIHMTYIDPRYGDYVNEVIVGRNDRAKFFPGWKYNHADAPRTFPLKKLFP